MSNALSRAIQVVTEPDLEWMTLDILQLPEELRSFVPLRSGYLDNESMAQTGFPGSDSEALDRVGRLTGYLREFGTGVPASEIEPGIDLAAATVVHLFTTERDVSNWIRDVFLKQFEGNVGNSVGEGLRLEGVERLPVSGFADDAMGIRALQQGPLGLMSSTVVDFRIGRLLGVAFLVTVGKRDRLSIVEEMAQTLERHMVRVALDPR